MTIFANECMCSCELYLASRPELSYCSRLSSVLGMEICACAIGCVFCTGMSLIRVAHAKPRPWVVTSLAEERLTLLKAVL